MAKVYTDVEALHGIRDAVIKLGDQMTAAQQDFKRNFGQMSEQISDHIRRIDREIESIEQDPNAEGRTDSFCCKKCGGRIMLKVMGDETHCREEGCDGIARRVYNNEKVRENRRKIDDLEQKRNFLKNTNDSLTNYRSYICLLLNTDGATNGSSFNTEHYIYTLNLWLASLGDYNAMQFTIGMSNEDDVKKKDNLDTQQGSDNVNTVSSEPNSPLAPNRKTPRDLPVSQYSFERRQDGGSVYDYPEETRKYLCPKQGNERRGFRGTCGLCSCANVIRLAGVDVREGDVIDYAAKTNAPNSINKLCEVGHLNPGSNGGTSSQDRKEILEHFGIDSGIFEVKRNSSGTISNENIVDIAKYVSEGRGVIISVHAYDLRHGTKTLKKDFHAVTVTSVKKDSSGNVEGFYICDTGIGGTQYYPAEVLLGALTGFPMNVTYQIIR